ncbi:MAG: LptF/LptG family permease [Ignavibacteriae bacterium]|nr:LptF/LptG family permease [Ignavibacteria bacterium]MBI3364835.1 LptF/LptG family permease [Ignavibacteriota bacterium]
MRLSFHILRAHIGPFFFALFTIMFIFLLQFLMKFADDLVGKGLSWWIIGELMALSLAWMVVLAVPMAVLVSTLMAFGNLSAQNEITAMKATGMSLYRMMLPVVLASTALTYLLIQFNNSVLPEANHRVKVLMVDIRRIKPTLTIVPGLFSQDIQGYSILARKTYEHSNDLEGITIYDYTDPARNVVVTAEHGTVSFTPDYRKLIMDLYAGEIHQIGTMDRSAYRKMRFTKHRIIMDAEEFDFERSNENAISRGDREMSAQMMEAIVDSLERSIATTRDEVFSTRFDRNAIEPVRRIPIPHAQQESTHFQQQALFLALSRARQTLNQIDNQIMLEKYNHDQIDQYLVEIHKKYSIPIACLVFVFIGAPLGVMARRGTFGVAASLSFGFFLLYWASLIGGEKLADRGIIAPWVGMWSANIVLSILGIFLTLRMGRETITINWLALRRFVPRSFRSPEPADGTAAGGAE